MRAHIMNIRHTDDDVRIPVREAHIDQDATDFFLLAAWNKRRGRGQVDIHVVGPLQLHARAALGAQNAPVTARSDDGQPDEVLYKNEALRGERAQRHADEDGELQASWWREPRVGAAAAA